MNQRDIELSEKAGLLGPTSRVGNAHEATKKLIALIRADERQSCENAVVQAVEKGLQAAIEWEREACAKVCESYAAANTSWTKAAVNDCATAIRARGNK